MLRKTPVALALGLAWGLCPTTGWAQSSAAPAPATKAAATPLSEITVTSTRTQRKVDNVPNTVTVYPAATIEADGARDIKDLFRNEIDVSVRAAPGRFTAAGSSVGRAGNEGINIRGLEGNQVLMLVDGIRVPNSFSFGAFATGRGDFLGLDGAQTVEVLRGPASTQFGSDGLAGAVSLRTPEPTDLLKPGRDANAYVRLGYASVDRSPNATVAGAARTGPWQGLLLASLRQGHEADNQARNDALNSTRTAPNPTDYENRYLLGKLNHTLTPAHQLGLTLESLQRKQDTEVYSARAVQPLTGTAAQIAAATLDLDTRDHVKRDRVSFEHRFNDLNAGAIQKAQTHLYAQDSEVRQWSAEDRNTSADRTRDNLYRQKVLGLSTQLESNFSGVLNQRVSYGADLSRAEVSGVRDGTVAPFGETFPTKPFPDTHYTLIGAFVQSEVEAGAFSVIPGLRFDRYELKPSSDGYTGAVSALSGQAVTPRLGFVWRLHPGFAPFGQVAKGFKAPTPDQVNNGFTNLASGYRSVGNPDLKAEYATSLELGVRGKVDGFRWSLTGFDNRYDDFIAQQVVAGAGTAADPLIFQYINLSTARIRGIEARTEWQIDPRWSATGGASLVRGYSEASGKRAPLDTVEPMRSVFGLRYALEAWSFRATWLHSRGKGADRTAPAATQPFTPPSYTVTDIGASWKALPNLSLHANVNNVLDKTYWRWSDVRGLASNSTVKDAYTAPGRNLQVSMRYDF